MSASSQKLRTANVAAVLDAVRETGRSAHPPIGVRCSDLVLAVAVARGLNPVVLQQQVERYADALDAVVESGWQVEGYTSVGRLS